MTLTAITCIMSGLLIEKNHPKTGMKFARTHTHTHTHTYTHTHTHAHTHTHSILSFILNWLFNYGCGYFRSDFMCMYCCKLLVRGTELLSTAQATMFYHNMRHTHAHMHAPCTSAFQLPIQWTQESWAHPKHHQFWGEISTKLVDYFTPQSLCSSGNRQIHPSRSSSTIVVVQA